MHTFARRALQDRSRHRCFTGAPRAPCGPAWALLTANGPPLALRRPRETFDLKGTMGRQREAFGGLGGSSKGGIRAPRAAPLVARSGVRDRASVGVRAEAGDVARKPVMSRGSR
jgi:hypothetical protein